MAIQQILPHENFYIWRLKTNILATEVGDLSLLSPIIISNSSSIVEAINFLNLEQNSRSIIYSMCFS